MCGRALPRVRGEFPYGLLWLPRLFQFMRPEDWQVLEENLLMLALAGEK